MIFITGPLYSGKRTFAQTLPGKRLSDVQVLAGHGAELPALADWALPMPPTCLPWQTSLPMNTISSSPPR